MKVIDKNKNKAVEVDSVSNNGEIYHVYDEGNQYRLFKDEVQVINQDTCIHEYTNQFLVVKSVLGKGLILEFPEKDKRKVALEGGGIWNMNSLVCGFNEVEESC